MHIKPNPLTRFYNPGGIYRNAPRLAPATQFSQACKQTPRSYHPIYIIPWDHANSDFVYSEVSPRVFNGSMSMRQLKSVIAQI